jgi:hypothetical protein
MPRARTTWRSRLGSLGTRRHARGTHGSTVTSCGGGRREDPRIGRFRGQPWEHHGRARLKVFLGFGLRGEHHYANAQRRLPSRAVGVDLVRLRTGAERRRIASGRYVRWTGCERRLDSDAPHAPSADTATCIAHASNRTASRQDDYKRDVALRPRPAGRGVLRSRSRGLAGGCEDLGGDLENAARAQRGIRDVHVRDLRTGSGSYPEMPRDRVLRVLGGR